MGLPLPDSYHAALTGSDCQAPNAGLLFDRGVDAWPEYYGKIGPAERRAFLERIADYGGHGSYLSDLHSRRKRMLHAIGGRLVRVATIWRLVSGLGANHVLENGFVFDRNLGVPYLSGSTVKGMLHAWAEQWSSDDDAQYQANYASLFGDTAELGAGTVIVHDAFPCAANVLELDVMSTHVPSYYRTRGATPPIDHESPSVVPFLVVKARTEWVFGLSPRPGAMSKADLDQAEQLLRNALRTLGIGAKTAVGYGHFRG